MMNGAVSPKKRQAYSNRGGWAARLNYLNKRSEEFDWDEAIARFYDLMEEIYGKKR